MTQAIAERLQPTILLTLYALIIAVCVALPAGTIAAARQGSWVDRLGNTWIFNAGRQIGSIPTTVSLDTGAGEAAWFSLEGAESVRLEPPLVRPVPELTAMPAWMPPPRAAGPT